MLATIQDYIDTLTPEEREKNKELILECLGREEALKEIAVSSQSAINKLSDAVVSIVGSLYALSGAAKENLKEAQKTLKTVQKTRKATQGTLSVIRRGQLDIQKPVGSA